MLRSVGVLAVVVMSLAACQTTGIDGPHASFSEYSPFGAGPYPGIIVLPVLGGMNSYTEKFAQRLSKEVAQGAENFSLENRGLTPHPLTAPRALTRCAGSEKARKLLVVKQEVDTPLTYGPQSARLPAGPPDTGPKRSL